MQTIKEGNNMIIEKEKSIHITEKEGMIEIIKPTKKEMVDEKQSMNLIQ